MFALPGAARPPPAPTTARPTLAQRPACRLLVARIRRRDRRRGRRELLRRHRPPDRRTDHVSVTSILSSPDADPHLFDPAARPDWPWRPLKPARFRLNGGVGYDAFTDKLIAGLTEFRAHRGERRRRPRCARRRRQPAPLVRRPRLPQIAAAITDGLIKAGPSNKTDLHRRRTTLPPGAQATAAAVADLGAGTHRTRSHPPNLSPATGSPPLASSTRRPGRSSQAIENGS